MQTYEIVVRERSVRANSRDTTLVRTSVGVDRVHVLFDNDEWLGFPVSITFAHDDTLVTQTLVISGIDDSEDWVAESWADVPWEVIESNGPIRITLQGTDSEGRHIITAKGAPLSVKEAGDVAGGDAPSDAPTISQWEQAYANAMELINRGSSMLSAFDERIGGIVEDAQAAIGEMVAQTLIPATYDSLGVVQVGDGLSVTESGVLSCDIELPDDDVVNNLGALANHAFVEPFEDGKLNTSTKLSDRVLPKATMDGLGVVYPDGVTLTVEEDGMIHAATDRELTPIATTSVAGKVKPDGETITVDPDGTLHGANQTGIATTESAGIVIPDGETIGVDQSGRIGVRGPRWEVRTDGEGRRRLAIVIPEE